MVARGRWWDQDRAAAGKSVAFERYADFFAYLPPARNGPKQQVLGVVVGKTELKIYSCSRSSMPALVEVEDAVLGDGWERWGTPLLLVSPVTCRRGCKK